MITANSWKCLAAAGLLATALSVAGSPTPVESPKPATLSGEAARQSEPGRAVVALITAARKGDRDAVRKLLLPDVVKDLDGPSGPAVMLLLATMADATISEITVEMVTADLAKGRVTKREGNLSESTGMTIKRVEGMWKISL